MEQKTSNKRLSRVISSFIKQLIATDHNAAEISFALAQEATGLGLDAPPNPELAMVVVMDGVKSGCATKLSADGSQLSEIDETHTAPITATVH